MKRLLYLLIVLVAFAIKVSAQENHQYFALIYTTGENWDDEKTYTEQAYFSDHAEFLSTLRKKGIIALGARYSDKGFIVLKVRNEAEAKDLIVQDISVTHKTFKAELYPFSTFYFGCIEKQE